MRGNTTRATLSTCRALFIKSMCLKMGIIGDGDVWKKTTKRFQTRFDF